MTFSFFVKLHKLFLSYFQKVYVQKYSRSNHDTTKKKIVVVSTYNFLLDESTLVHQKCPLNKADYKTKSQRDRGTVTILFPQLTFFT